MLSFNRRTLLVSLMSMSLMACGFHLRGKIDVPDYLQRVHIKGSDIELKQRLGDSLAFSDIDIVDTSDDVAILDLAGTGYEREVNGTDGNGLATSYKLKYTVVYKVFDLDSKSVLKQRHVKSRTLAYDSANVLLFEREEEFLKEDMQKELVTQMLRHISKIK